MDSLLQLTYMSSKSSSHFYALLSGAAFLAALLLLVFMLWQAQSLSSLGLTGKLYYLILVPLGLAVAAFLFGLLKSYATYRGEVLGGTLELGGPVVVFWLVLVLGFWLVPNTTSFNVTVFLHHVDSPGEPFLHPGKVLLRLGGDPRVSAISEKGEAYFIGIPSTFRTQRIPVQLLETDGYEVAQSDIILDGEGVQLAVQVKPALFRGYVKTPAGRPISAALVSLASSRTYTDAGGYFEILAPSSRPGYDMTLQVDAIGYAHWFSHVTPDPNGHEITAQLEKANGSSQH